MKKIIQFGIIVVLLFIIIKTYNNLDRHAEYEKYLNSIYTEIPNYTKTELENIPKPEHPHLAGFQNRFMTIDPNLKRVPSERLHIAFKDAKSRLQQHTNIIWNNTPSMMGGRTRTIMFDPNDDTHKKVWAAGVSGGLWYNNDITNSAYPWHAIDDFWDNLSVSKICHDPNNPMVFYVGTGEANTAIITYRESSSKGIGIWKSVDGGNSWELLSSTELFAYITDIEIRDEDGVSVIYAGVASGEYYGTHESQPSDGLYRSDDGGNSWEQVLPNIINTDKPYTPSDIEITSDGRIFIGTMKNLDGYGGATILFSDEGIAETWSIYDDYIDIIESDNNYPIPGRVRIASSPSHSNYIYAIIGSGYLNNMGFNLSHGNYIIKSTDAGLNWNEIELPTENGNEWASLAWHALGIEVHPNNPNTLFCGGLDLYRFSNNSWTKLSDWALMYQNGGNQYIHADIHDIIFRDGSTNQFVITTDGGVFYSANANLQTPIFEQRNNYYTTLQFYTCDLHPSGLNYFMGGLQDNGTLYTFNSPIDLDNMISGGDGAYCFYDASGDNLTITSTYYNRYYFFNGDPNDGYDEYYDGNSGVFINPADYDPQNNIIYANAVRFNGSNNNRLLMINNTANNPSGQIIQIDTDTDVYFSHVKFIAADNSLLLGTQSGKIYKVENIDEDYDVYELTDNNMPIGNVSCIATANENHGSADTLAVTFSNYGIPSVWTSINQGETWENSEYNLPDMPIRWIVLHPQNANYALLATEIGIWYTNNLFSDSTEWFQSTNGMANVRVDMLQMREADNMVLAATHGRGLFYGIFNVEDDILYGDLNNDGGLNIQDVILLVNLILNNDYNSLGDMDQNNTLDVLDVIQLIQIIIA